MAWGHWPGLKMAKRAVRTALLPTRTSKARLCLRPFQLSPSAARPGGGTVLADASLAFGVARTAPVISRHLCRGPPPRGGRSRSPRTRAQCRRALQVPSSLLGRADHDFPVRPGSELQQPGPWGRQLGMA